MRWLKIVLFALILMKAFPVGIVTDGYIVYGEGGELVDDGGSSHE